MNDSQKRREALLRESRQQHFSGDLSARIPAVHPRYRAAYRDLYGTSPSDLPRSTVGVRILISLVLFAVFAAADYRGEKLWHYTPDRIAAEIQNQPAWKIK